MSTPLTLLAHIAVVETTGADGAAFLQRQCMSDVSALARDGDMQWSGLLSAKGRVLFLFRLLRLSADRYLLMAPAADAAALIGELQRYVLRSKLRLRGGWEVHGAIGDTAPVADALAWDAGRWVVLRERSAEPDTTHDVAREWPWQDLDLLRGIPQVGPALSDRFTPQMLGLNRLQAFSLSKGCYPGQEVVARTHYLGQQKREWTLLRASRDLRPDEPVFAAGRELGRVAQIAPGDSRLGAAVLPLDAPAPLQAEDGCVLHAQMPERP